MEMKEFVIFILMFFLIILGYLKNVKGWKKEFWDKWFGKDKNNNLPYWYISLLKLCGIKEKYYISFTIGTYFIIISMLLISL
jgi:hypothetical protein